MAPLLFTFSALPKPLIALILVSLLPAVSAAGAAESVDTAGFWVGFSLLVIVSAVEAGFSVFWTRIRITSDGVHPYELSCRVCGREVITSLLDPDVAAKIAEEGLQAGLYCGSTSSMTRSRYGVVMSGASSSSGCSTCGGWESRSQRFYDGTTEAVIDKFGSLMLVPTLLIRRFNPATSLSAPTGLLNNIKGLVKPGAERSAGRVLEHLVHLIVGLTDVSLGIAGLALSPGSPQKLYATLKDPRAPITFENYSTLFLLYWLLGALLLVCMIPQRSTTRSIQMLGLPGAIAFGVASLASLVLFAIGCWKIDYSRRHHLPWTPMLSYWIGGASAIGFPLCGIEVLHTFGVVGLVFMLLHTFN